MTADSSTSDRALPLRERKKLRTRRALADAALRMFTERGFEATTVEELVDAVEVSRSSFFRIFPAKEAAAIEAEAELWSAYLAALERRALSGLVVTELSDLLGEVVTGLGADWADRYVATRRLVLTSPALLAYAAHYRAEVEQRITDRLAGKLALPPGDLRPQVLAEVTTTAWRLAARTWVHGGGQGGLPTLVERVARAFRAIPASLELSAPDRPAGAEL
ncbi:TetR family transcriptional regulator [Micromonospora sp. 4G55]|uniref:TetR family transcriptional regulator n=1 Tax=Micromonospora sp. 4G55 TaxID=2806102 RepID=UPI001A5E12D9|nr:TetR family transcriptional regulator [Micromonospora sp. 4G55]MBM0256669.1 TetR family transcriptional regulator [Micromonospora sp. 4G55]